MLPWEIEMMFSGQRLPEVFHYKLAPYIHRYSTDARAVIVTTTAFPQTCNVWLVCWCQLWQCGQQKIILTFNNETAVSPPGN